LWVGKALVKIGLLIRIEVVKIDVALCHNFAQTSKVHFMRDVSELWEKTFSDNKDSSLIVLMHFEIYGALEQHLP